DYACRPFRQFPIVDGIVCRSNQDYVKLRYDSFVPNDGFQTDPMRMLSRRSNYRHMRIEVSEFSTRLTQQIKKHIAWRFAIIVNIRLVSEAQYQDTTSFERFAVCV